MNNEEKNIPQEENTPEINSGSAPSATSTGKVTPGLIGIIVGGFVMLILAIVLMFILIPGGDGPTGGAPEVKGDYTVTVVDGNGNPIQGVKLSFITPKGIPFPGETDAQGKATYKSDEDGVTVKITSVPKGYEYDGLDTVQSFDSGRALKVTVTAPDPFVITVVDDQGNPIAGVSVMMCDVDDSCRMPTETDSEGKAYYPYEEGQFRVKLTNGAPDGYTIGDPDAYHDIVNGSVTITLTKIAD